MKIAFLTTPTQHHAWYLQELKKHYSNTICISESNSIAPSFDVFHPFEIERKTYELDYFFSNKLIYLSDVCETFEVEDINQDSSVEVLENFFQT